MFLKREGKISEEKFEIDRKTSKQGDRKNIENCLFSIYIFQGKIFHPKKSGRKVENNEFVFLSNSLETERVPRQSEGVIEKVHIN